MMMMMMMMRRRRRRRRRRSTANMFSSTQNLSELVVGLAERLEGRSGGKHKPGKSKFQRISKCSRSGGA